MANIVSWAADTARRSIGRRQFARARRDGKIRVGADFTAGPFARFHPDSCHVPAITIGAHVFVDCTLITKGAGRIVVGSNCWIGGAGTTAVGSVESIHIGSDVIISNNVHIYDHNSHPTDPGVRLSMTRGEFFGPTWEWTESASAPVVVEDNVWIGEYSMILKGVTVGKGSIVAAHAVVTKDVPPYTIVAGNPARPVKKLL